MICKNILYKYVIHTSIELNTTTNNNNKLIIIIIITILIIITIIMMMIINIIIPASVLPLFCLCPSFLPPSFPPYNALEEQRQFCICSACNLELRADGALDGPAAVQAEAHADAVVREPVNE